jgi:hypothetical protein
MCRSFLLRAATYLTVVFGASAICVPAFGQSSQVISVEEHWELQISQPDPERSAPQVTMVMSPTANLDGAHFFVTLNHATEPEFESGGVHVQHYDGTELISSRTEDHDEVLNNEGETIRWTQRMTLHDGTLTFSVWDGESQSWNHFGGDDLTLNTSYSGTNLNTYRPAVSLTESQVNYAENRVVTLVLKKLVWTTADGQVHEQNAPIPIDTSLDN